VKPSLKKNIHPVLADIKHPRSSSVKNAPVSGEPNFFKKKVGESLVIESSRFNYWKKAMLVLFVLVVVASVGSGWYLWSFKNDVSRSASAVYGNLKSAALSLVSLENDSANFSLDVAEKEITDLEDRAIIFSIFPVLREIPKTIREVRDLTNRMKSVNENVGVLKVEGFRMLFGGEGEKFISLLKSLKTDILAIEATINSLKNKASRFGVESLPVSDEYLALNVKADRLVDGLDAFIGLLEKPGVTHFVLAFENPSEMRPAGGFVGSYADVILESGSVKTVDVDDIYRPDRFLDLKVVPPKQLQGVTPDWGARDANWFFNFPDSAEKLMEFLQASSVYEDQGVTFDGVIAVNVRVMEDILKIIGPVEIPEYKLVLNDENFLREVQQEVEAGRDKKPGQNPKKVLKFILPEILEKLDKLNDAEKKILIDTLGYRLINKDVRFYFKDKRMQNIVTEAGWGGEVYAIPATWTGDYLAVVDTNVAGGETDAFISQKIELVSKITSEGAVNNNLTVTRKHSGQNEKESWYKTTNQNFIKVFTPLNSKLIALTGNTPKSIKPLVSNYPKSGYAVDEDLQNIESTEEFLKEFNTYIYKESGKTVFSTWFSTAAGKTGELALTYANERKIPLRPGTRFQFVFDKQSGVESQFDYILEAPPGFKWEGTNDFIYRYKSDTIPSRLIVNLTLEKM